MRLHRVRAHSRWQAVVLAAALLHIGAPMPAKAETPESAGGLSIESLMKDGWKIAGYTGSADGWSAFILFQHPSQNYLVQCRAGYDVLRQKRVTLNCYELR